MELEEILPKNIGSTTRKVILTTDRIGDEYHQLILPYPQVLADLTAWRDSATKKAYKEGFEDGLNSAP